MDQQAIRLLQIEWRNLPNLREYMRILELLPLVAELRLSWWKLTSSKPRNSWNSPFFVRRRDHAEKMTNKISPLLRGKEKKLGTVTRVLCNVQKKTHRNVSFSKETRLKLQEQKKKSFFTELQYKGKKWHKQVFSGKKSTSIGTDKTRGNMFICSEERGEKNLYLDQSTLKKTQNLTK